MVGEAAKFLLWAVTTYGTWSQSLLTESQNYLGEQQ
jgi:hypothetical protein